MQVKGLSNRGSLIVPKSGEHERIAAMDSHLDFHSGIEEALPGGSYELRDFLNAAASQLSSIAEEIRTGDQESGLHRLAQATGGLELALTCCSLLRQAKSIHSPDLKNIQETLSDTIQSINKNLEDRNFLDLADLIEYEMKPTLLDLRRILF